MIPTPPRQPTAGQTGERALRVLRSLWLVPTLLLSVIAAGFAGTSLQPLFGHPFWVWWVVGVVLTSPVYALIHHHAESLSRTLRAGHAEVTASHDRLAASHDQLAALNAVSRVVAAELDLDRALDVICAQLAAALGARRAAVSLRLGLDGAEKTYAAFGFDTPPDALDPAFLYPDSTLPEAGEWGAVAPGPGVRPPTGIHAPIVGRDGLPLGTLYAADKQVGAFDAADEAMLAAIATQAAVAITNARLYGESRRRGDDLRSLAQRVAEAVAASDDIGRIAALVAEQALKLVGCDGAGVFLLGEDRQAMQPAAARQAADAPAADRRRADSFYAHPLPLDAAALVETTLTASRPLQFTDVGALGEPGAWAAAAGIKTLIAAPLRGRGQGTTGLLLLHWSRRPRRLGDDELDLIAALAGFAAVAVENARLTARARADQQVLSEKNARLLDETRRRGEELQTLVRRVGDALAAGLSSVRVAELVTEQTRQMILCRRAVFFVREGDDFRALAEAGGDGGTAGEPAFALSLGEFPFLRDVLERSNPVVIADVALDLRLTARERVALRRADVSTLLLAPLRGRGDRVVGLLSLVWTGGPYVPSPEEFKIADVLATQAAAALENARLYQDLERAEAQLKEQLVRATAAHDLVERILLNVPAAVLVLGTSADYPILRANALAEQVPDLEQQQDGLEGRPLGAVFPDLDALLAPALERAVRHAESSTLTDVEYRGFARGTTYWTFSVTPQRDPATRRVAQIIVLALETTDRIRLLRENQRHARQQQQRANELDATLRSLGDGVVLCDAGGRIVSVNRAGQEILEQDGRAVGQHVDEWATGIRLCYLTSGQAVPPGAVPLARALRSRQADEREEYLVYTGGGRRRVIELTATPVLPAGAPDDSPGGAVAVFRDITDLKQSQMQEAAANHRVETLVHISRRLNATLELDEIHAIVTEGALALLPLVSDARALLYARDGDELALLSATPDRRARSAPFALRFDADSPLVWQLYVRREPAVSGDVAADAAFADDLARAVLRGGPAPGPAVRSALLLPLMARDVVSGHLVLTSSAPDAFGDPRLADALTNLAALAVIARTNGGLYLQMRQKAEELNALWTVGKAIAEKLELNEVVDTLTDRVRSVMGAEACTLALFSGERGGERRLALQGTGYGDTDTLSEPGAALPSEPCDPVTQEAARTGEPAVRIGTPNSPLERCPWRPFAGRTGTHSVLAMPLKYGEDTLGCLTVYRAGDSPFLPEQFALLGTLSALAVAVVRNAQTFAYEHNLAQTLQKSFLPEHPTSMRGLDIAEKYFPTLVDEAAIGGDYYDFVPLGPRRLGVIIGDISGKGLAAAVHTAMAKYTLRAFAAQEMPPQEVVARANTVIARHTTGEIFSTLFYGVLDLNQGTLTYVNAGHEPPQLRRAGRPASSRRGRVAPGDGGEVIALEPTGLMLGAFADAEYEQSCVPLMPGDVLALYTDGLPDARAADGSFLGETGIRTHLAAAAGRDAAGIAVSLHEAAVAFAAGGRLRDDIALLVLKVEGAGG